MADWLFGDLLYWFNAIFWCINLLIFYFLVFNTAYCIYCG